MAKINQSTASKKSTSRFPIPSTHITTFDVGQLRPVGIFEGIAGDKLKINFGQFSRLTPLAVPSFGTFTLKTFAFFVPYFSIWQNFEAFRTNNQDSSVDKTPYNFSLNELFCTLFVNPPSGGVLGTSYYFDIDNSVTQGGFDDLQTCLNSATDDRLDFILYSYNKTTQKYAYNGYNCNSLGRWFFNILRSLGYEVPSILPMCSQNMSDTETDPVLKPWYTFMLEERYTLLPFLAFFRCLYDYIYPSAYVTQLGIRQYFEDSLFNVDWTDDREGIKQALRLLPMRLLLVPYQKDFFTSGWASPNQVAAGSGQSTIAQENVLSADSSAGTLTGQSADSYTVVGQRASSTITTLSSYALRWLQAASDYVMRNNIGGSRIHEWLRAHFGFATQDEDKYRSRFIKSYVSNVNINTVTSTADTVTAVSGDILGAQSAVGDSRGAGKLSFEFPEDGFVIFLSMIVPFTGYYQGIKPFARALKDYRQLYVPEYDSVGLEAIPRSSVYFSYDDVDSLTKAPQSRSEEVFMFAPRYAERYKKGNDFLTGDFRFKSRNVTLAAYHTMRDVLYGRDNLALDANFMKIDNQFNRIFTNYYNYDHFLTIFQFDATINSHKLSIGESMPIFEKSGRDVELDYQGTQL